MIRKIIKIDEDRCNGCGLCAEACHEGAIGMVNGKAKLLRDDYCDGLGDCLPVCPADAIHFEEREAAAYDREAVEHRMQGRKKKVTASFEAPVSGELGQWPVQIKLVPVSAPYFDGANLLVAADCTAFAYGDFHRKFIRNHVTLIGCPKLDSVDYSEKLTEIIKRNEIRKITVVRMEVPCCGGIVYAVEQALKNSGKVIPWEIVTVSTEGDLLSD